MGKKDPRVDAYIERSQDFAKPILKHMRKLVHKGCPDVVETIKWGAPFFEYEGVLACMASFKQHATFGFWKGALIEGIEKVKGAEVKEAMGQFGRITSVKELPSEKAFVDLVKKAVKLNVEGVKHPTRAKTGKPKEDIPAPDYFLKALRRNKDAQKTFESFSPSHKREYLEWIIEAKTEATREKRIEQAIEWMSEGKSKNWKYMRK